MFRSSAQRVGGLLVRRAASTAQASAKPLPPERTRGSRRTYFGIAAGVLVTSGAISYWMYKYNPTFRRWADRNIDPDHTIRDGIYSYFNPQPEVIAPKHAPMVVPGPKAEPIPIERVKKETPKPVATEEVLEEVVIIVSDIGVDVPVGEGEETTEAVEAPVAEVEQTERPAESAPPAPPVEEAVAAQAPAVSAEAAEDSSSARKRLREKDDAMREAQHRIDELRNKLAHTDGSRSPRTAEQDAELAARLEEMEAQFAALLAAQQVLVREAQAEAAAARADRDEEEARMAARLREKEAVWQEEMARQRALLHKSYGREREDRLAAMAAIQAKIDEIERVTRIHHASHDLSALVHRLSAATLAMSRVLSESEPFPLALTELRRAGDGEPLIIAAVEAMPPGVELRGVTTLKVFSDSLIRVERRVRRVALVPPGPDGTMWHHVLSCAYAGLTPPRSASFVEGLDVDAVFARAKLRLDDGDLGGAVNELNGLPQGGWATRLLADWMRAARERLVVQQNLQVVEAHVAAMSASLAAAGY